MVAYKIKWKIYFVGKIQKKIKYEQYDTELFVIENGLPWKLSIVKIEHSNWISKLLLFQIEHLSLNLESLSQIDHT